MTDETMFDHVGLFHNKFDLPVTTLGREAAILTEELFQYRVTFLREELDEFVKAHAAGDLTGAADALADLVWVALGTAHFLGLPFNPVWAHVRHANMLKERARTGDASHKRGAAEFIRKPPDWVSPEKGIQQTLETWNNVASIRRGRNHR